MLSIFAVAAIKAEYGCYALLGLEKEATKQKVLRVFQALPFEKKKSFDYKVAAYVLYDDVLRKQYDDTNFEFLCEKYEQTLNTMVNSFFVYDCVLKKAVLAENAKNFPAIQNGLLQCAELVVFLTTLTKTFLTSCSDWNCQKCFSEENNSIHFWREEKVLFLC